MSSETLIKAMLGLYSKNGNHRPDQYPFKCKKCSQWNCTYRSDRIGRILYKCTHCGEYNHIDYIKEQNYGRHKQKED